MQLRESWLLFALGSAVFAALTALFGKLGVVGINSNLATFIRTVVILFVTAGILSLRQEWAKPSGLPLHSWLFLVLSGIATVSQGREKRDRPSGQHSPVPRPAAGPGS